MQRDAFCFLSFTVARLAQGLLPPFLAVGAQGFWPRGPLVTTSTVVSIDQEMVSGQMSGTGIQGA